MKTSRLSRVMHCRGGFGIKSLHVFNPLLFMVLLSAAGYAVTPLFITGTVYNTEKKPVAGADVRLIGMDCRATTANDGTYSLDCRTVSATKSAPVPPRNLVQCNKTHLLMNLQSLSSVHTALYSLSGRCCGLLADGIYTTGQHAFRFPENMAPGMYLLRSQIGGKTDIRRCLVHGGGVTFSSTAMVDGYLSTSNSGSTGPLKRVVGTVMVIHPSYPILKNAVELPITGKLDITLVSAQANWVVSLGTNYTNQGNGVVLAGNGHYIAYGEIIATRNSETMGMVSIDPEGTVLSINRFDEAAEEVTKRFETDGIGAKTYFGTVGSVPSSRENMTAVQLSSGGDSVSRIVYTGKRSTTLADGKATPDGGCIFTGYEYTIDSATGRNFSDAAVARYTRAGELLWAKEYHLSYYTTGYNILALIDGGYMLAGTYHDSAALVTKVYAMSIAEEGTARSTVVLDIIDDGFPCQLVETRGRGILLLGRTPCNSRNCSYLACFSHDGAMLWDSLVTDPAIELLCMAALPDSTVVVAARAIPAHGSDVAYTYDRIKLFNINSKGILLREKLISEECGQPQAITPGAGETMVISSVAGESFLTRKYYITNVSW